MSRSESYISIVAQSGDLANRVPRNRIVRQPSVAILLFIYLLVPLSHNEHVETVVSIAIGKAKIITQREEEEEENEKHADKKSKSDVIK